MNYKITTYRLYILALSFIQSKILYDGHNNFYGFVADPFGTISSLAERDETRGSLLIFSSDFLHLYVDLLLLEKNLDFSNCENVIERLISRGYFIEGISILQRILNIFESNEPFANILNNHLVMKKYPRLDKMWTRPCLQLLHYFIAGQRIQIFRVTPCGVYITSFRQQRIVKEIPNFLILLVALQTNYIRNS